MAYNFSANQYEYSYSAKRLCNWTVPKWYPPHPRQRIGCSRFIANDHGHILPKVKRTTISYPFGCYHSTWQLPKRMGRKQANEINAPLVGKDKWPNFPKCDVCDPSTCKINKPVGMNRKDTDCIKKTKNKISYANNVSGNNKSPDLEYIPGDLTEPHQQHSSRQLLLQQKFERDHGIEPEIELNKLYLGDHECKDQSTLKAEAEQERNEILSQALVNKVEGNLEKMNISSNNKVTEKPTEQNPSPVIPAYCNFQMAKKMHHDNLDHQPLPDCVADQAFRKFQMEGNAYPGLVLDLDALATGVGVKTHNAGPTHCTKMKVYRPKTCGVVPKGLSVNGNNHRPFSSAEAVKKMGAMDLAIRWDYRPINPADEPRWSKHIDGTNDTAGPAIFNLVQTPRTPEKVETGRSAGVFTNTFGEAGFFEKDIVQRKAPFNQQNKAKCTCGTSPITIKTSGHSRSRSVSRQQSALSEMQKQYQSSPNISQFAVSDYNQYVIEKDRNEKKVHSCSKYGPKEQTSANSQKPSHPGFFRRTARMCHKVAPQPFYEEKEKEHYKSAFKAGKPNGNPTRANSDSGCSTMSSAGSGTCSTTQKVLVIPRPRNPYNKKNYNIKTLVPPFTSYKGGAGQGGYPEHWRLASVYQHAYKPVDQRKKPLLQTVYQ